MGTSYSAELGLPIDNPAQKASLCFVALCPFCRIEGTHDAFALLATLCLDLLELSKLPWLGARH